MDNKSPISQQLALVAKVASSLLGCVWQSAASRSSEVTLPFTHHW